jgi:hypothetical protein
LNSDSKVPAADVMALQERRGLWALFGFSLFLKLWNILDPFVLRFVSDEAIMGLMAKHFWEGEFALFYYGQAYGGGIEYLLDAVFYFLLPNDLSPLRFTSGVLLLTAELLVYQCARTVFATPLARLASLAIFMCGSYTIAFFFSISAGMHLNNLVAFAALLTIYLHSDCILPKPAIVGLLVGTGFWVSNFIWVLFFCAAMIPLLSGIPIKRYLRPEALRGSGLFLSGLCIGALPRIMYWLNPETWHIGSPFGGFMLDSPAATGFRSIVMLVEGLPRFFFGTMLDSSPLLAGGFTIVWAGLLGRSLATARLGSKPARALLVAVAIACLITVLLVVTNRYTYDSGWRYIWPLLFLSAFSAGHLVEQWKQAKAFDAPRVIAVSGLALVSIIVFWTNIVTPRLINPHHNQFSEIISALERHDCKFGYAPYNYAYTISYLTDESIILESLGIRRIKRYSDIVSNARRRCIILDVKSKPDARELLLSRYPPDKRDSVLVAEENLDGIEILVEQQ